MRQLPITPAQQKGTGAWSKDLRRGSGAAHGSVLRQILRCKKKLRNWWLTWPQIKHFLKQWAEDTGDFVSNERVVEEIKGEYEEEFLGGQNHYAEFADMVQDINAKILTEYDQTIETLFTDSCLTPYSKGEVDQETAIQNFKDAVVNAYPDVQVD